MSERKHGEGLRAGTAVEEISLETGVQLSGYGVDDRSLTGVHDPLLIQTLVMADGGTTVAVVSLDLLNVYHGFTRRVRRRIDSRDVAVDEILLAATHTHAGPYMPADSLEINPNHQMETDGATVEGIEQTVVDTVTAAHEELKSTTLRIGRAENEISAANRRLNGGVSGTIRMPRGEIDPELVALHFETGSGEDIIVFNYACHPVCTTSNETLASADWPGYARRDVSDRHDATVIFLNGAAGDINPRGWPSHPEEGEAVYQYMEEVGTEVAGAVEDALSNAAEGPTHTSLPIFTDRREFQLPTKDVPAVADLEDRLAELTEEIERLKETGDEAGLAARRADRGYIEELLGIARGNIPRFPASMPYIEIGDIGLLGMPGEIFVEHGLDFKAEASVDTLLPIGYTNEYVGYIPTLKELENIDYEIQTMKVAPEAIPEFRETALDLL